jgi:predicted esterase YcpF (UPF0227 family)
MIIGYLHGFASYYDDTNPKVKTLGKLGTVIGLDINYNTHAALVISGAVQWALDKEVDLIVGCSMGGWLASHVGSVLGIPFVALNPAVAPSVLLIKYLDVPEGETDFGGYPMASMDELDVKSYPDMGKGGYGLILLEEGDDLFNWENTKSELDKYYKVVVTNGGSHRFESLEDHLFTIQHHVELSELVYGADA